MDQFKQLGLGFLHRLGGCQIALLRSFLLQLRKRVCWLKCHQILKRQRRQTLQRRLHVSAFVALDNLVFIVDDFASKQAPQVRHLQPQVIDFIVRKNVKCHYSAGMPS